VDAELGDAGDGKVVGIEGDEFRVVVDAEGGDDEVERTGVEPGCPALLTEAGGIAPKSVGSWKEWQGFELGFDPFLFLRGCVAEDFKGDGFAEAGKRIEDPRLDQGFESKRRLAAGEVHPKRGFDQSRHGSERVWDWERSAALAASKVFNSADHWPVRNLPAIVARRCACKVSASNLRMAGPFFEIPVISQISTSSVSGRSTVIFIDLMCGNRTFCQAMSYFSE